MSHSAALTVETPEQLYAELDSIVAAQKQFASFTQEQVDKIVYEAAVAANQARVALAIETVEESGMGIAEDKVIKNHFAAEYVLNKYRDMKTCDIIEYDAVNGITKVAEPVGVIAAIIPCTNPTSTAIFKCLIALKTRNAIIVSPHKRTQYATVHACSIINDAAVKAGLPNGVIRCLKDCDYSLSQPLLTARQISLILATGGPGLVQASYSSGHPALGVGAGNTPSVIDETADIQTAVSDILMSKSFDNGMICASEQHCVIVDSVYDKVMEEFQKRGAYLLTPEQKASVDAVLFSEQGALNANIVGKRASVIAEMAGIEGIPDTCRALMGVFTDIGRTEPFSREKLSPTLGITRAANWEEAIDKAVKLLENGGLGHTATYHTDAAVRTRIEVFESKLKAGRILINTPATQGAIGDMFNFRVNPSLTLGCGSWGGNSVSENVGPMHLLNVKTVAERRENMLWFRAPPRVYFKPGCLDLALKEVCDEGAKKVFIVTDKVLFELGVIKKLTSVFEQHNIPCRVYYDIQPDPTLKNIRDGLSKIREFNPDTIIAVGGGSPIDAAKIMRMMYEYPETETEFHLMNMRFLDIRKRIYRFRPLLQNTKSQLICVPTTSGTGSEVTPFAVITDDDGAKYPLADYELTPQMAICDSNLVLTMPKFLAAITGLDVLTHAIEAYVSVLANDFTNGMALQAIKMVFDYLVRSVNGGAADPIAREKVHNASTLAGIAFSNAFLGINHSIAHKIGAHWHIPHGLANSLVMTEVIKFNSEEAPFKMGTFPQYKYPVAASRYAEIADFCGFTKPNMTVQQKVDILCSKIEALQRDLQVPMKISECKGAPSYEQYLSELKEFAVEVYDDQCTPANPRLPLFTDIEELMKKVY